MYPIPLPPSIELPGPFVIPKLDYKPPEYQEPKWEPITIYKEDVQQNLKASPANTSEKTEKTTKKKKNKSKNKKPNKLEEPEITNEVPINSDFIDLPTAPQPELPVIPFTETPSPKVETTNPPRSEFKEVRTVTLPIIGNIPVPKAEILVTATSTAAIASVASVGGTLAATAIFQRIIQVSKPLMTLVLKKVARLRGKQEPLSWARRRVELRQNRLRKRGTRI